MNELHREVTPLSSFDVPEVLEVHVVPSGDVRMVPDLPTVTKVPFPEVTPLRYIHVPEVLSVQVIPSGEVRMVPDLPTLTNNPVEVVVEPSSLLLQEMKVELKRRRIERMMSICFTWVPISGLGEPYIYHDLGEFTRKWGFTWRFSDSVKN